MATGMKACGGGEKDNGQSGTQFGRGSRGGLCLLFACSHLEHLDEGDGEMQVCLVAEDETATEEGADGED